MSQLNKFLDNELIKSSEIPNFIKSNLQYECMMGSHAYGCENDDSDIDIYGFCISPKNIIFPHLDGEIIGFGKQKTKRFEQWTSTSNNLIHPDTNKNYDFVIYNIVKYFQLCMDNNPNMIDSLFVPDRCITHRTNIFNHVRVNRKHFLYKGCFHKFRGYSFSQLKKMKSQTRVGKRKLEVDKYGYDRKFAYHVVRLVDECEQILLYRDIELDKNREKLKAIRRCDWSVEDIEKWFNDREHHLTKLYEESKIPYGPDEDFIKSLLLECLEIHYGNLDKVIEKPDIYRIMIQKVRGIVNAEN